MEHGDLHVKDMSRLAAEHLRQSFSASLIFNFSRQHPSSCTTPSPHRGGYAQSPTLQGVLPQTTGPGSCGLVAGISALIKVLAGLVNPDSRTITAWGLKVENGTSHLSMAHVDAVNGNSLTAKTFKNRDGVTIQLDANTAFKALTVSRADRSAKLTDASQADITANSHLLVEGTASADGKTITATAVIIVPAGKMK